MSFQIDSCDELLLGGNEKLSNVERLKWRTLSTAEAAAATGTMSTKRSHISGT